MALHTSAGLVVLAAGLSRVSLHGERAPLLAREEDRVTFIGAFILTTIALAAGIASFAILQTRMQHGASEDILNSLQYRTQLIEELLRVADVKAQIAATRPAVQRTLRVIRSGLDDGTNRANIEAVVANFLGQGF